MAAVRIVGAATMEEGEQATAKEQCSNGNGGLEYSTSGPRAQAQPQCQIWKEGGRGRGEAHRRWEKIFLVVGTGRRQRWRLPKSIVTIAAHTIWDPSLRHH
uniref:Uncharacterized protein n=1 Tax=Oryza punctata TaxID=4537 RepID=A0A0E0K5K4_ORYPU